MQGSFCLHPLSEIDCRKRSFDQYERTANSSTLSLGMTAGSPREHLPLTRAQATVLRHAYGRVPSSRSNDGIVPTTYQVWGEVLAALDGAHLDVIGHFRDPATTPPHVDWMTTGSGFTREQFESLWTSVVARIRA